MMTSRTSVGVWVIRPALDLVAQTASVVRRAVVGRPSSPGPGSADRHGGDTLLRCVVPPAVQTWPGRPLFRAAWCASGDSRSPGVRLRRLALHDLAAPVDVEDL